MDIVLAKLGLPVGDRSIAAYSISIHDLAHGMNAFSRSEGEEVLGSASCKRTCWYTSPGDLDIVGNDDFRQLLCVSGLTNDLDKIFMLYSDLSKTGSKLKWARETVQIALHNLVHYAFRARTYCLGVAFNRSCHEFARRIEETCG